MNRHYKKQKKHMCPQFVMCDMSVSNRGVDRALPCDPVMNGSSQMKAMGHVTTLQLPSRYDEWCRGENPRWKLHSIIRFSPPT